MWWGSAAFATRGFQQLAVEDICTAYCALAPIMHQLGRLNDTMKQKVIKTIDAGGHLAYWQQPVLMKDRFETRKKA